MSHALPVRVYYEDTDAGGIVYHASYIRFAERGRTEMLRDAGFNHAELLKTQGIAFAVVSLTVNYKLPAKLDDLLVVKTRVVRLGGASFDMEQNIYRGGDLICEIKLTLVAVDQALKAVRLPDALRELFKSEA
jgi:acyl-CoA thioester hydrolase